MVFMLRKTVLSLQFGKITLHFSLSGGRSTGRRSPGLRARDSRADHASRWRQRQDDHFACFDRPFIH